MDIEIGSTTYENTMFPELYGLDEALWLIEGDQKSRCLQNQLDDGLHQIVDSDDFDNTFGGSEPLFDDWMTTKTDFSLASFCVNMVPNEVAAASITDNTETIDYESSGNTTPQSNITSDDSTTEGSMLEGYPTSPEQHVPGFILDNQQIKDFIDMIRGGAAHDVSKVNSPQDGVQEKESNLGNEILTKSVVVTPPQKQCLKVKVKAKTPEQKQKKRLQNRNAATRYRSKKRGEQDALTDKCNVLEEENQMLKKQVESLEQETKYLKNLIVDVFQKKMDKKMKQNSM